MHGIAMWRGVSWGLLRTFEGPLCSTHLIRADQDLHIVHAVEEDLLADGAESAIGCLGNQFQRRCAAQQDVMLR